MIKFYELCSLRSLESDGGADCGGDFLQDRREEIMGKLNTNHPHFDCKCQWNVRKYIWDFETNVHFQQ